MLVTGAAGFIGSNFTQFWAEHHPGDTIVGVDALTYAGNLASLEALANHERFRFVRGDIRDGDAMRDIIKREGIDTIVHFAAESHVDRSIHGPDPFIDTNIRGTHELLSTVPSHFDGRGLRQPRSDRISFYGGHGVRSELTLRRKQGGG